MVSIEDYVSANAERFYEEFLRPWLQIPSISASPDHVDDVQRSAHFLQAKLQDMGFDVTQYRVEKGNNVVYAEKFVDPDLPTIVLYGHHDVQPIHKPKEWVVGGDQIDPFNSTRAEGRIYNRGATDDKGQLGAHLLALEYFKEHGSPCNVKVVIEGNEEGSIHESSEDEENPFHAWVKENGGLLSADAVLISDTSTLQQGYPALTTSLKGLVAAEVQTDTPESLVEILHKSHLPVSNRVLLEGIYDGVVEHRVTSDVAELLEHELDNSTGRLQPEAGWSVHDHMKYRPTNSPLLVSYANMAPEGEGQTFRIVANGPEKGYHSGTHGGPIQEPALLLSHLLAGLKEQGLDYDIDFIQYGSHTFSTTIQPTGEVQITVRGVEDISGRVKRVTDLYRMDSEAFEVSDVKDRSAYLQDPKFDEKFKDGSPKSYMSFRLVDGQDPGSVYDSLTSLVTGVDEGARISSMESAPAFATEVEGPYSEAVIEALKKGYGTESVHIMAEGGSIPITTTFAETLGAPVILMGFSSPTDGLHGPNESFPWEDGYIKGALSAAHAYENIAEVHRD